MNEIIWEYGSEDRPWTEDVVNEFIVRRYHDKFQEYGRLYRQAREVYNE